MNNNRTFCKKHTCFTIILCNHKITLLRIF